MRRKIFFLLSFLVVIFFMAFAVFSATNISRIRGSFLPDSSWHGGHPGNVLFDIGPTNSGFTALRDQYGYLTGFFWIGNVGWGTFSQTDASSIPLCRVRVVCPDDILKNPNQACPLHGCVWTQNAGWTILSGSLIGGTESGVYYNPTTGLIEGWGWNKGLGWIPFYAKTVNQEAGIDPITSSGVTMEGIAIEFIGKIAIIGNIAGTRIFDLPTQNVGFIFNLSRHASVISTIKKNIALMTRNIDDATLSDPTSDIDFIFEKNNDYIFGPSDIWPVGKKSIIVIGHDIILDSNNYIGDASDPGVRALIALKDQNGSGGNIIVSDRVKRIYSLLYAEGSLFSGVKTATGYIDQYLFTGPWNIPQQQLYIKGLLVSKNTISGARQTPPICPVTTDVCNQTTAEYYDLNYFRTYDPNDPSQTATPYSDPRLNEASMIIEYNDAVFTDTPPGLTNALQ